MQLMHNLSFETDMTAVGERLERWKWGPWAAFGSQKHCLASLHLMQSLYLMISSSATTLPSFKPLISNFK